MASVRGYGVSGFQPEEGAGGYGAHGGHAGFGGGGYAQGGGGGSAGGDQYGMRGGGGWRAGDEGVYYGQDRQKGPRDGKGGGWQAPGGGGPAQAVEGAPPVPLGPAVKLELTGTDVWQARLGGTRWQDVDETWTQRLSQALRDGESTITLPHVYCNSFNEEVHSWYEIDFTGARNGTSITQMNCHSCTVRTLRVIELMAPPQQVPLALPSPPAAEAAGAANVQIGA